MHLQPLGEMLIVFGQQGRCLAQAFHPRVGLDRPIGASEPIEGRGEFDQFGADFKKLLVEKLACG